MNWYDAGMPVTNDAEVLGTAELIRRLYAMPGCSLGGPLHAMLDDGNIDDEQLDGDYYQRHEGQQVEQYLQKYRWQSPQGYVFTDELSCTEEVADLCRLILASFRRMPEPWRAAAIAWFDGTVAENLPILVDNPEAACTASPEQVDELVADLRLWIEQGENPAPKQCVAIPCPPFTQFPPGTPEWQREAYSHIDAVWRDLLVGGVSRVRYEQGIDHPGVRVTRLDGHGNPIEEPRLVSGWAEVDIKTDPPGSPLARGELRWVETTIEVPAESVDPGVWSLLHAGSLPDIDMQQVREQPPLVKMPQSEIAKPWFDSVRDNIPLSYELPLEQMPTFVRLPEGTAADTMQAAIELCRRAGLLDTPNGYVLLPAELDASGSLLFPILGTDTP